MLSLDALQWAALGAAALAAGLVDAVVGGGGMIQLPAMFALLPEAWPAALLGTSKLASVAGTSGAAWHYARHKAPPTTAVAHHPAGHRHRFLRRGGRGLDGEPGARRTVAHGAAVGVAGPADLQRL